MGLTCIVVICRSRSSMIHSTSLFRFTPGCNLSTVLHCRKFISHLVPLRGVRRLVVMPSRCAITLASSLRSQLTYSNMVFGSCRSFASKIETQEDIMNVFDRSAKRKQRNRTAFLKDYTVYDYIKDEVSWCSSAAFSLSKYIFSYISTENSKRVRSSRVLVPSS